MAVDLPLLGENPSLPRLNSLSDSVLKKSILLYLHYPNNPTGAVANQEVCEEVVQFAKKHGFITIHYAAEAALVFGDEKLLSFLSVTGLSDWQRADFLIKIVQYDRVAHCFYCR